MQLDLDDVAVCAEAATGPSKSVLSRRLARLEAVLGVTLATRTARGIF